LFTGLIQEKGIVKQFVKGEVSALTVSSTRVASEVAEGDSVSVSGVCLTVKASPLTGRELTFDAVRETIERSTLGDLKPGDAVNLETALRAGQMMGGHIVQGHVDGIATIARILAQADSRVFRFACDAGMLKYIVEKGSVAVDGISLTVASCDSTGFEVAVIPHTLDHTTLVDRRVGDKVNVETDILGKYVEKFLGNRANGSSLTEEKLRGAGFM
jgi:riboflavin synthase